MLALILAPVLVGIILFFVLPALEKPREKFLHWIGLRRKTKTKKEGEMKKSPLKIKDSEFKTAVENAKDAVGMEVNTPAELDGVKSELIARNVDKAVGFTTNQPMNIIAGTCRRCNRPLASVTLGERPSSLTCKYCGEENPN
jgi:hypothetical protein